MLNRAEALARAAKYLDDRRVSWKTTRVRLMPEIAFEHDGVLIVPFNSIAFLDEGNENSALGGNMPIRVDLISGQCDSISLMDLVRYMKLGLLE
jgi:hypothetical protein